MYTYIKILCLALAAAVWLPSTVIAQPNTKDFTPVIHPESIFTIIDRYADEYGVRSALIRSVMRCESGYDSNATHISPLEKSYGISQINLIDRKDITIAQARNPYFATEFMAKNLSEGNNWMWKTCYKRATL